MKIFEKRICPTCHKREIYFSWDDECYTCRKNRYKAQIKDDIASGNSKSTSCEDEIFCPWCGGIYDILDDYELYDDGDHDVKCPACEKHFHVNTSVSYHFSTDREVEEDA